MSRRTGLSEARSLVFKDLWRGMPLALSGELKYFAGRTHDRQGPKDIWPEIKEIP